MEKKLPENVKEEELIYRDILAIDRTCMALERTLLTYIRTALTFILGGITLIKFFDSTLLTIIGFLLIPAGLCVLVLGFISYRRIKSRIKMCAR